MLDARRSGILMPISSLPGPWGIGCLSAHARDFVDSLARAGQSIWQILPLGPTGYADSPYSSFSTHAGNHYFIDLDRLVADGLLDEDELRGLDWGDDPARVDYGALYASRNRALRTAFASAPSPDADPAFGEFCARCSPWLDDFALFMTIKGLQGQAPWQSWPEDLRHRRPDAIAEIRDSHGHEITYWKWLQWVFDAQWSDLHSYARSRGISILGDLPIYVAADSADAWSHPELFDLDEHLSPRRVAGVPPDGFSATGQVWGNPLYDWDRHRDDGYAWWVQRMRRQLELVDLVRLDHFRGLESYFAIPAGHATAADGQWCPGPGMDLFDALREALGPLPLIVEDLGYLTDGVIDLRARSGFPGMQILQFAFDSREPSDYRPHRFPRDCVVYTGTHDNDTLRSWYGALAADDRAASVAYLNNARTPDEEIPWDFITRAMTSVANTCIVPMGDYLCLDGTARINTPAVPEGNWQWRMLDGAFTDGLADRVSRLTRVSERAPAHPRGTT
ncbi:4-alpha-glucanotransferase [Actinomyces sp. B33]|uniref:4-alpha-glucanotransferase n=1 Tax=Actinomyces sp. B33 TaxID=2942131 RepID=UPI00233FF8A5|nr:4-alpha-glucanotransferase [Actinomyces sp. B33]MDC4232713.1 4-alpha-glucanotransferase [Actinomyces sp. B33]